MTIANKLIHVIIYVMRRIKQITSDKMRTKFNICARLKAKKSTKFHFNALFCIHPHVCPSQSHVLYTFKNKSDASFIPAVLLSDNDLLFHF